MNNNTIILSEHSDKGELTIESINALVLAGIVPKDTPKAQVQIFAHVCKEKGISPFSKEIYLLAYKDKRTGETKYAIITGIDGFRKIAARTGQLAGCNDALFDLQPNGDYKTPSQYKNGEFPKTCTITSFRIVGGIRCPFTHTAVFNEFSSGQQKWSSMPFQMIMKVAEAFALRKGFGDATSGIAIEEEIPAMSGSVIAIGPVKEKTKKDLEAEADAFQLSENWLQSFKDTIELCLDYNETKNMGNQISKSPEYKLLNKDHKLDFIGFVKAKLTDFQANG